MARLVLASMPVFAILFGGVRPGTGRAFAPTSDWIATVPAGFLLVVGASMRLVPGWRDTDWLLLGNDSIEHVLLVGQVQQAGGLSYASGAYPRGMHQVMALLVSAEGNRPRTAESLLAALHVTAGVTWVAYTLLVLATALATVHLTRRLVPDASWAGWVGALAGSALLTPSFFTFSLAFGFVTTVGLATILAVAVLELARAEKGSAYVLLACAALSAHVWQLGWPPVLLALLLFCWAQGGRSMVARRLLLAAGVSLAIATPALLGIAVSVAPAATALPGAVAQVVASPGAVAGLAVGWLLLCVTAAVTWTLREHRADRRTGLGLLALGCFAYALLVGLTSGDLLAYYPRKLLWHALVVTVPLVAAFGAWLGDAAVRRSGVLVNHRRAALALSLTLLATSPASLQAASGGWTRSDGLLEQLRLDAGTEHTFVPESSSAQRSVIERLRSFYLSGT